VCAENSISERCINLRICRHSSSDVAPSPSWRNKPQLFLH
jgi:hypothetical protein